jgi:hypothetical protein
MAANLLGPCLFSFGIFSHHSIHIELEQLEGFRVIDKIFGAVFEGNGVVRPDTG